MIRAGRRPLKVLGAAAPAGYPQFNGKMRMRWAKLGKNSDLSTKDED